MLNRIFLNTMCKNNTMQIPMIPRMPSIDEVIFGFEVMSYIIC